MRCTRLRYGRVEGILLEPFLFLLGSCHAARRSSALMTLNFPRVHSVISAVLLPACGKLSDNTSCISTANEKHVTHLRKVAFECFRRHPGQRTSSTSCRLCRFDCFHGHCHPKVSNFGYSLVEVRCAQQDVGGLEVAVNNSR